MESSFERGGCIQENLCRDIALYASAFSSYPGTCPVLINASMSTNKGVVLPIRAVPNAPRSEVTGWMDGGQGTRVLKVRIKAPAVEGKANAELLRFLAERCGVRPGAVSLVRGDSARLKLVRVEGIAPEDVAAIFGE